MFERLLAPLLETLRPHFGLSKTRLKTLAVLLFGLANCRTVQLSHLASRAIAFGAKPLIYFKEWNAGRSHPSLRA